MPLIIVAITSLLGLSIFAFSDAGKEIAAPVEAVKETLAETSKLGIVLIIGLGLWFFLSSR